MLGWVTRCLPGLSIIVLVVLLLCAFTDLLQYSPFKSFVPPSTSEPGQNDDGIWSGLSLAQSIFVVYGVLVHAHMLGFTLRLGWSMFRATVNAKVALERRLWQTPSPSPRSQAEDEMEPPLSPISMSSADSLIPKIAMKNVNVNESVEEELVHAIILPNYCEDIHTLETTLKVLASHPRAKSQYEVSPIHPETLGRC